MRRLAGCLLIAAALGGCTGPSNPSFPLSVEDARADLERMRRNPMPAARPIVVVGGYADPGFATSHIRNRFRSRLTDATVITVSLGDVRSMESARRRLIEAVESAAPSDDPEWTVEVDVVGSSMGGLVARDAARPRDGERALRAARIFTIATPHMGATMAESLGWTPLMRELQPASEFVIALNGSDTSRPYELIPYARTGDGLVGEENTAPPGETPWWTPAAPFLSGHFGASTIRGSTRTSCAGSAARRCSPSSRESRCRSPPADDAAASGRGASLVEVRHGKIQVGEVGNAVGWRRRGRGRRGRR